MTVAIAGAWELTDRWAVPELSVTELHTRAAIRALQSCGLGPGDVDGLACGTDAPVAVAAQLGIDPGWTDGTSLPNVAALLHLRHAEAAIAAGQASVVVITHGESHRSRVGIDGIRTAPSPASLFGQFDAPTGVVPAGRFAIGLRRYLDHFGVTEEALAEVPVVERQWASLTEGAAYRDPISVDDVLASPVIADPLHRLHCGATTDGAGALVVTSVERARDLVERPVLLLSSAESYDAPMAAQVDPLAPAALRRSAATALARAGAGVGDLDHAMLFDGFAHGVLLALEALGACDPGGAADLVRTGVTAPGGRLPVNTNGGFLNYRHGEMAQLQEAARRIRDGGATTSFVQGSGQAFGSAAAVVLGR